MSDKDLKKNIRSKKNSKEWKAAEIAHMLDVFNDAAKNVPSYGAFLKHQKFSKMHVGTIEGFSRIPPITKKNYLRKYPWGEQVARGALAQESLILTATSGSTGKPSYFPRTHELHERAYEQHKIFIENSGLDPKKPTLVIVAFGMGVWIGGIITYEAFRRISKRDFPMTILTPGVNKKEIYDALHEIGAAYPQVILCGYPPFVKDIIDNGPEAGVDWSSFDMRIVCAAEGFSEEFRDYLIRKGGMKNPYRDIMNIYGSAELGTMATETPLSILVRQLSLKHPALYSALFSEATRLPTLAQYVPTYVSFEAIDNRIYCTSSSVLPMVRYEIGDHGGVFTYDDLTSRCKEHGIDLRGALLHAGITNTVLELPFVYIYERADLSTKLYGAIIYPEHVKHGLMHRDLQKFITTKFTMFTRNNAQQDAYLEVNVELQSNVSPNPSLERAVSDAIMDALSEKSAEHRNNVLAMGDRVRPHITFWPLNDKNYFSNTGKHKWVKQNTVS
jgi:phenylacetate-CoA ligase